eukprot:3971348-Amphidinium_carterae.1
MNAYIAVTVLNTKSMAVASKQWWDNNGLATILSKFLEADGKTIKPQYVTADNGLEVDRDAAMPLHNLSSGTPGTMTPS